MYFETTVLQGLVVSPRPSRRVGAIPTANRGLRGCRALTGAGGLIRRDSTTGRRGDRPGPQRQWTGTGDRRKRFCPGGSRMGEFHPWLRPWLALFVSGRLPTPTSCGTAAANAGPSEPDARGAPWGAASVPTRARVGPRRDGHLVGRDPPSASNPARVDRSRCGQLQARPGGPWASPPRRHPARRQLAGDRHGRQLLRRKVSRRRSSSQSWTRPDLLVVSGA